ncbi:SDR family oxidoreductase [Hymenobacter sp.]|uniref:SDR family oxidoreductase n=1 Tax=Hymenobacter sp. TaxID=1898978 RepID=UPI00286B075F|nr:SDR family oxidoreductase [Hymenobacter sp.]
MNLFDLANKTAIVTGACGLIGQQHCAALAQAGAHVVVADLDLTAAAAVAARLPGGPHLPLAVDVTSPESLAAARDHILAQFGHLDVLVNNAAINDMFENPALAADLSRFENFPLTTWQKSLEVNVTGIFLAAQVFGTPMAAQGHGSIINVASTYGIVGPDQSIYRNAQGEQTFFKSPSYPATKGAVISFTRYLAAYWGPRGVRVNTLSPGGVENSQDEFFVRQYSAKTPLGRMAAATDYQGAVVFLASDASAYMTGANLVVDGGWTAI